LWVGTHSHSLTHSLTHSVDKKKEVRGDNLVDTKEKEGEHATTTTTEGKQENGDEDTAFLVKYIQQGLLPSATLQIFLLGESARSVTVEQGTFSPPPTNQLASNKQINK